MSGHSNFSVAQAASETKRDEGEEPSMAVYYMRRSLSD
jgi:hypothetical protein